MVASVLYIQSFSERVDDLFWMTENCENLIYAMHCTSLPKRKMQIETIKL
jgi:hypothetical protein